MRLDVVDLDAVEADREVGRDRAGQLAAERLRLAVEVVPAADERGEAAGVVGHLFEQGAVDVVADADAEHAAAGRARCGSAETSCCRSPCSVRPSLSRTTFSGRAGVGVAVRGRHRRVQHRAARRLLRRPGTPRPALRVSSSAGVSCLNSGCGCTLNVITSNRSSPPSDRTNAPSDSRDRSSLLSSFMLPETSSTKT